MGFFFNEDWGSKQFNSCEFIHQDQKLVNLSSNPVPVSIIPSMALNHPVSGGLQSPSLKVSWKQEPMVSTQLKSEGYTKDLIFQSLGIQKSWKRKRLACSGCGVGSPRWEARWSLGGFKGGSWVPIIHPTRVGAPIFGMKCQTSGLRLISMFIPMCA